MLVRLLLTLAVAPTPEPKQAWSEVGGWVGQFQAKRSAKVGGGKLGKRWNDSATGDIKLTDRDVGRHAVWKGESSVRVTFDQEGAMPFCDVSTIKGSGLATVPAKVTIDLRRQRYVIRFGNPAVTATEFCSGPLGSGSEKKTVKFGNIGTSFQPLPADGMVLSGTATEQGPAPMPFEVSWTLSPDACSSGEHKDVELVLLEVSPELTFNGPEPGKAVDSYLAETTPPKWARDVAWDLPEIDGSTLTLDPDSGVGSIMKLEYEGMPVDNIAFGDKQVKAQILPLASCTEPVMKTVRFLFAETDEGNPTEQPNWFHYWRQTKATAGVPKEAILYSRPCLGPKRPTFGFFAWPGALHRSGIVGDEGDPDHIFVCDLAQSEFTNPITRGRTDGIDTFAVTVIHEWEHREHYRKWWRKFYEKWGKKPNMTYRKKWGEVDADGDDIPDTLEPGLGMNPKMWSTHNYKMSDEHYLAWKAEARWTNGTADKEDWAKPGKQSGK